MMAADGAGSLDELRRRLGDTFDESQEAIREAMVLRLKTVAALANSGLPYGREPRTKGAGVPEAYQELSRRERQVLQMIAEGHSTKQIAAELGISFKTAVCHRTNLMGKLSVHETASLVRIAIRAGLVEP